jgi:UDP-3-O-[3-hydroxymyristoyl] N-acetylglucosamine deacetylase
MLKQRTLKAQTKTTGVGLHTGARVELGLRPAPPDAGIVFHRTDLPGMPSVAALAGNVGDTRLSSTLKGNGASISTVEHLMSALAGLGIDNLHVDIAGPEIPIMDGSAGPFVFLLQSAGIVEQAKPKRYLRVTAPVEIRDGDRWARFEPWDGFKLDFTIDFPHPVFGLENRQVVVDFSRSSPSTTRPRYPPRFTTGRRRPLDGRQHAVAPAGNRRRLTVSSWSLSASCCSSRSPRSWSPPSFTCSSGTGATCASSCRL